MSWDWDKLKQEQEAKRNNQLKKKVVKPIKIPEWFPTVAGITTYVVLAIILVAIFWSVGRWWNYKFSYEKKFQQTVIEMVKPEALKDEYKKAP